MNPKTMTSGEGDTPDPTPSDVELTTHVKERHVGWIDDPISDLSDASEAFGKRAGGIYWALSLSLLVSFFGALLTFFPFLFALLDLDIGGAIIWGAPFFVFLIILVNSFRTVDFVGIFARRLGVIATALDFDPQPKIPEGRNPVDRFLRYLENADERFAKSISKSPQRLKLKAQLTAKSGKTYSYDAYILDKGGWKRPRYHMLLRVYNRKISKTDMVQYMRELEDVLSKHGYPTRVFAIQTQGELDEKAIEYINSEWLIWKSKEGGSPMIVKTRWKGCPIEIIRESEKGTYDFGIFYFG